MVQTTLANFNNYINGKWIESKNGDTFESVNPANITDIVARFPSSTEEDAEQAINAASTAFPKWSNTSPSARAGILNKAADILEKKVDQIAEELTREEGKPLSASKGEVKRTAQTLRFYAVEGLSFTGETFPNDDRNMTVYTALEPLGVITVITPWNFPISIPSRKIAPALMMGNTVVFKPSSDTPLVAYRLVEAFHEAGIPEGVINFVTGPSSRCGKTIVSDPAIRAVTFTGSTAAGKSIHNAASLTTRTQMELGGKNPIIVMNDADLDKAVELTVNGGFNLSGQACTGTSRVIVMESLQQEFVERLAKKTKTLQVGSGMNEEAKIGPLANEKQLKNILNYINIGKEEGATLVHGGEHLKGTDYDKGYYVQPAIFKDVTPQMRIAQEEIFGPVISVISAKDYEDAISIANDVEYGLSASIVTRDIGKIQRFTKDIQAGTVKVNRTTTGNLINAPFGGLKNSSTSTFRESGRAGLAFFTQIKTVYIGD
jgi:acyl-CoA reductase-like NAD-dependent aldehyde dehydrogenase